MTEATDTQPAQIDEDELDYPEAWRFDKDGDRVAGTFAHFDQGQTKEYGPRVIMVLNVDGTERAVWLSQLALHSRVRDEVNRRPTKRLEVGERVVVKRLPKKMGENNREYWPFQVLFPDRPELSPSDLFELDEGIVRYEKTEKTEPASEQSEEADGDEPF